jgi:hypothetical protein
MRNSLLSENSLALDVLTGNDETIDFDDILRGILQVDFAYSGVVMGA